MKDSRNLATLNQGISSVSVRYDGLDVGTIAMAPDGVMAFEYSDLWLREGFSISPFSLPLEKRVFVAKRHPLDGVFGVFDDSLPDGWGRLLVDRMFRAEGIDPFGVSPLLRLSVVGKSGMGALEYIPETPLVPDSALDDLDQIALECENILKADYSDDLDSLFALGGSSGGARPKILTNIDGEAWIIKFPSSFDSPEIGEEEYEISALARQCGIDMPETRLFPSKRCKGYFGIKRFDRPINSLGEMTKIHMASAGALLETSHRTPNLDYSLLMKLTLRLTGDFEELERLYRLMCFNVFIGNRDDHSKNFTFLHAPGLDDWWTLAPGYDLTRNAGMNGEHATTVNGKGRNIEVADLVEVGVGAGLSVSFAKTTAEDIRDAAESFLVDEGKRHD